MILKELHLSDALGRISIFPPLTHNGEVRILTWPQVIDISKIRDIQIVGTSGLIKFWKLEKMLLRTVTVARAYTFLEVRSRDSTWWPDLMWPRHKNFTTDVKLINEMVCQFWLRCSLSFSSYPRKTTGGGAKWPPPTRAKVKLDIFRLAAQRWQIWQRPALASVHSRSQLRIQSTLSASIQPSWPSRRLPMTAPEIAYTYLPFRRRLHGTEIDRAHL